MGDQFFGLVLFQMLATIQNAKNDDTVKTQLKESFMVIHDAIHDLYCIEADAQATTDAQTTAVAAQA